MAVSCVPSDLSASAKCFAGLTNRELEQVKVYLLATIAGGSTDPATLTGEAKAFGGLTRDRLIEIEAYLLCAILNK